MRQKRSNPSLTAKAEAAFEQASRTVVEIAKLTKTPVIVWEDGRVVEITSEQAEMSLIRSQAEAAQR